MTITDDIFAQLSGAPMQQISQQLGLGQTQTAGAIAAALPMLIGALGRNTSQPQGAEALFGALQRDHAGGGMGLGDLLGAVLGGQQSRQTDGAGMLGHIFGDRTQRVGPGSVIFQAANQPHAIRNVGDVPATYHVIKWNSPGMLKKRAAP